ncbi:MAG TPA: succinate dehydrogenase cytochrome b subunit [Bacteroidia bacterium]|nr:succinate dehydrogenase cytochrome b subunit [Bacteroidia bacterium]
MNKFLQFFGTSLGKKILMACTGLFLCAFLIEHLYGNLMLYRHDNGAAFDLYTKDMTGSLLIRIIEIGLFATFFIHIIYGIAITLQNRKARPIKYAVKNNAVNSTWFSRNMIVTGLIVLIFLSLHLFNFFIPHRIGNLDATETYYQTLLIVFHSGLYVSVYCLGVLMLGAHLNHGLQSAFQSLGLKNKKYTALLSAIGSGFALIMTIGFISFPILFYFGIVG